MILEQAEKLFAEKGYYGLGLSELLKRCEIPKGSFYYYFPNGKIQLIEEVLEYSYQHMRNRIDEWMTKETSAQAAFSRMADRLTFAVTNRRHLASMLMSMIAIESVYLDEQVNKTCRHIYCDWREFYAECLRHFGYEETESKRVAQALFALVHGSLISSWIKQSDEDLQLVKEPLKEILNR